MDLFVWFRLLDATWPICTFIFSFFRRYRGAFFHPNFHRDKGSVEELALIKRRPPPSRKSTSVQPRLNSKTRQSPRRQSPVEGSNTCRQATILPDEMSGEMRQTRGKAETSQKDPKEDAKPPPEPVSAATIEELNIDEHTSSSWTSPNATPQGNRFCDGAPFSPAAGLTVGWSPLIRTSDKPIEVDEKELTPRQCGTTTLSTKREDAGKIGERMEHSKASRELIFGGTPLRISMFGTDSVASPLTRTLRKREIDWHFPGDVATNELHLEYCTPDTFSVSTSANRSTHSNLTGETEELYCHEELDSMGTSEKSWVPSEDVPCCLF